MVLIGRFCIFFQYKTVNCHLQVPLKQTGLCHDVSILHVSVWSLLPQYSILRYPQIYSANMCRNAAILPNGPAIWGGCVTRRSIRQSSWCFSQKIVPVRGGYGACFCRHVANWCVNWVSRYKLGRVHKVVRMANFAKRTLAQRWRRKLSQNRKAVMV